MTSFFALNYGDCVYQKPYNSIPSPIRIRWNRVFPPRSDRHHKHEFTGLSERAVKVSIERHRLVQLNVNVQNRQNRLQQQRQHVGQRPITHNL